MHTYTHRHTHIDLNVFYTTLQEVEELNFQGNIEELH